MHFVDIIEKKKRKEELTDEEIAFWISGYVDGSIPDYQVSALLMAIVLNGMTDREISTLTRCMMNSGDVADLSQLEGIKLDVEDKGGVGLDGVGTALTVTEFSRNIESSLATLADELETLGPTGDDPVKEQPY